MSSGEKLALEMGLDIPDFDAMGYYGADYGTMKPYHRVGSLLFLSGHLAQAGSGITHRGRLGAGLTVAEGYQAARRTWLNVLCGIRRPVGLLDRVKGIVRSLTFVVCPPEFEAVHRVSSGLSDLLLEVVGPERGLGGRATIGVMALAGGVCFETWVPVAVAPGRAFARRAERGVSHPPRPPVEYLRKGKCSQGLRSRQGRGLGARGWTSAASRSRRLCQRRRRDWCRPSASAMRWWAWGSFGRPSGWWGVQRRRSRLTPCMAFVPVGIRSWICHAICDDPTQEFPRDES
ncbi:MAG: RidA family protein [Tabrizicola sp.]